MTFVKLDPEALQSFINTLNDCSARHDNARSRVYSSLWINSYPADIDDLVSSGDSSTIHQRAGDVANIASDLQTRLDEAKAMNESGVTPMDADGSISYYLPDGYADTVENVVAYNSGAASDGTQAAISLEEAIENGVDQSGRTVEEIITEMSQHQDIPAYSVAFIDQVGLEDLTQIPIDVEIALAPGGSAGGGIVSHVDYDESGYGQTLADTIGHMLAAASTTWDDATAQEAADSLARSIQENPGENWATGDIDLARMSALNTMLGASRGVDLDGQDSTQDAGTGLDFNDAFLVQLGADLEQMPSGIVPGIADGGHRSVGNDFNPLDGLVHAMTANPDAARQWLAPTTPGSVVAEADAGSTFTRLQAMVDNASVGDNRWTDDWAAIAEAVSETGPSSTSFGLSIQDPPDTDGTSTAATVSGILSAIGESGEQLTLSGTAQNLVAETLSRYPVGVQVSAQAGNPKSHTLSPGEAESVAGYPEQPLFSDLSLSNLIGQVGQNEEALALVTASQVVLNYYRAQEAGVVAQEEGVHVPLADALKDEAATSGFIAGAIGRTSEQIGAEADAQVRTYTDMAANLANAIPLVPQGGSLPKILAGFARAEAVSASKTSITDALATREAEARQNNSDAYTDGMVANQTLSALTLLQTGLYSPEELLEVQAHSTVDLSSIINSDGTLNIGSEESLTAEQYDALAQIGDLLPVDNHVALVGIQQDISEMYGNSYSAALPEDPATAPNSWGK